MNKASSTKGISKTASAVILKLRTLISEYNLSSLFDEATRNYYFLMYRYLNEGKDYSKLDSSRKFQIYSEELLLPGDYGHVLARKWKLNQILEKNIDTGFEQIIVLGSGLDHLSLYASHHGVKAFELDLEPINIFKNKFYDLLKLTNDNLFNIDIDFRKESIFEKLSSHPSFQADKKTLVFAEGLFDYLANEVNQRIVEDLKKFRPGSKLVYTFFELTELNFFHRTLFKLGLWLVGEPIRNQHSILRFQEMVEANDFYSSKKNNSNDLELQLKENFQLDLPVLNGFYIIECEKKH